MTYLTTNIFKPAEMTATGQYPHFQQLSNHPTSYVIRNGRYVEAPLGNLSQLFGVGDLYMPVSDMLRFDQALMSGRLISSTARQQMLTAGSWSTYGMGFYCNPGSYSNHGVLGGFNIINSISRSGRTTIVLMANVRSSVSFGKVVNDLYGLLDKA